MRTSYCSDPACFCADSSLAVASASLPTAAASDSRSSDQGVLGDDGLAEAVVLGGELRGLLVRVLQLLLELAGFLLLGRYLVGRLHDDLLPLFSGSDQPLHAGSQSFFHFSHCSLDACCLLLQLLPCVKIINFPGSNSVSLTWPMRVFGSTNMHKQTI